MAGVQLMPQSKTHCPAAIQQYVALVSLFNGLHLRMPYNYTDYYSFTDPSP